jgi:hypothetical protein
MSDLIPNNVLVAFSFAGEQRELVSKVASLVKERLGDGTVFFDDWYQAYLGGPDGDLKLQAIYNGGSKLVVVCVSEDYAKPWCHVEHEAIRAFRISMLQSNVPTDRERILTIRVGDGDVPGIPVNAFCPDIREKPVAYTADLIIKRLRIVLPGFTVTDTNERSPAKMPKAFLAECTPDLDEQRERIRSFILEQGWSVLSSAEYNDDSYDADLQRDLQASSAFVQVLGRNPWRRGSYDRRQHAAAVEQGVPRYQFRNSDVDLSALKDTDPAHHDFVTASDVIVGGLGDFKSYLAKELRDIRQRLEHPAEKYAGSGPQPLIRVVIRSPNPDPLWDRIFSWIYEQQRIRPHCVAAGDNLEEQEAAEACQGFLVVCDRAAVESEQHSPRTTMEQCRLIQLKIKDELRRPPVGLVYWPPPEQPAWSRLLHCVPPGLHRMIGGAPDVPPPEWGNFIDAVRRIPT